MQLHAWPCNQHLSKAFVFGIFSSLFKELFIATYPSKNALLTHLAHDYLFLQFSSYNYNRTSVHFSSEFFTRGFWWSHLCTAVYEHETVEESWLREGQKLVLEPGSPLLKGEITIRYYINSSTNRKEMEQIIDKTCTVCQVRLVWDMKCFKIPHKLVDQCDKMSDQH